MLVTYSPKPEDTFISGLTEADLIYEYLDKNNKITYQAIFYDNVPKKVSPILSMKKVSLSSLPKLNFIEKSIYSNQSKNINFIYVTLDYDKLTNFIYEDGYYIHYKGNFKDLDKSNFLPINISNIIIQMVNSTENIKEIDVYGNGKGLLFSQGKVTDIKWSKDKNDAIKLTDNNNKDISLLKGKTWWLIVNDTASIAYN